MADKLLLVTTFVVLTLPQIPLTNHVPIWLTVLVISRDIVIVARRRDRQPGRRPANVPAVAARKGRDRHVHPGERRHHVFQLADGTRRCSWISAIWLALALTLASAGDYFFRLRRLDQRAAAT